MRKGTVQDVWKLYIQRVIVFLTGLLISMILFFLATQQAVNKNIINAIDDNLQEQSRHFQMILEVQYQYLEGVADYLAQQPDPFSDECLVLLSSLGEKSELERIAIIDRDGMAYYDDGNAKSVKNRRYFAEGMSGQRTLSDPLESRLDGETRVVLGVPVMRDGEVIGVLCGSFDVSALSRMLFEHIYHGKGSSIILGSDGSIIAYDNRETSQAFSSVDNLFTYLEDGFSDVMDLQEIRDNFKLGESGHSSLKFRESDHYVAYEPLGFNDWMILYVVPATYARESYSFITDYEMILSAVFIVMTLSMLWSVFRISERRQKKLIAYANTDALTGLSNKQNTEKLIQEWIDQDNDLLHGPQAFLIMDIDFFKTINDRCGHAVGDEVLRRIGSCLTETFRDSDIIGRIGGDEFVVFLKNAGNTESVENRTKELIHAVRSIEIPELKGHKITCSIGVAYYPDHGEEYLDLYKHADMALYEIKKDGRNGYCIYGRS